MSATVSQFDAIKERRRRMWASGGYAQVAGTHPRCVSRDSGSPRMIVRLSHPRRWFALLLAGAPLASASGARAAVVHTVCGPGRDFPTVTAAVNGSSAGDAIEVMPGTYDEQVVVNKQLTISGAPGDPRPVIEYFGMDAAVTIAPEGAGTKLSDIDIHALGQSTWALLANGGWTYS
ncbi:MAG: hypothetical protein ACXVH3_21100 [Solirubrobacteraceae bacterium]